MAEATAIEPKGDTILTQKEEVPLPKEDKLFQSEQEKQNAIEKAKADAIKELETKEAAAKQAADDKAAQEKAAKEKVDAEAAEKARLEKEKTEGKDGQTPKKEEGASPKEYTLTLPENSPLTKEDLDGLMKEAKESGLTEEQAKQALAETDAVARTAQKRLVESQQANLKQLVEGWKDAVKKDAELGGDNLAATAIKASRAAKAVFDLNTLKFLEDTGYANHPGLVRAMVKVYDLIGEDKFIKGTTGGAPRAPTTTEEKARKLFSNPIKESAGSAS